MDRDKVVEQSVSDAITAKPIRFSISHNEKKSIDITITEKKRYCKYVPFFYKSIDTSKTEEREVEIVDDFEIHPPTLGKIQILSKLYLQLEFNEESLSMEPHLEAMRVCETHTDTVCNLMAISICKTELELLDDKGLAKKAHFFKWHCTPDDFASCLLAMLTQVDYVNFITSMRLMKMLRLNKPTTKRASRIEQ